MEDDYEHGFCLISAYDVTSESDMEKLLMLILLLTNLLGF